MKIFVSVIIPVFNNPQGVEELLNALTNQTYPLERYEIIIIDNNSTDFTLDIAAKFRAEYPGCIALFTENIQNSYAARNKGLKNAKGNIVAFIDSDCIPVSTWLESGIRCLSEDGVDLLGGNVRFIMSANPSPSEMFDSISFLDVKGNIEQYGGTITANLFVRKNIFNEIGYFPTDIHSGADMLWTKRATQKGFQLKYCSKAEVLHPARKLMPLLSKMYRVGKGQPRIWLEQGESQQTILSWTGKGFLPVARSTLHERIANRGTKEMKKNFVKLWFVAWLSNILLSLGRLNYFVTHFIVNRGENRSSLSKR